MWPLQMDVAELEIIRFPPSCNNKRMLSFSRNSLVAWRSARFSKSEFAWHLVCDVDGVLTDGKFHYSNHGKAYKVFGSHDADALNQNSFFSAITFISADERGFAISSKRVEDMGFKLSLKSATERLELIKDLKTDANVAFIGDSFSDIPALKEATLSATPRNAYPAARRVADLRLKLSGGNGAVAELLHLLEPFSQSSGFAE